MKQTKKISSSDGNKGNVEKKIDIPKRLKEWRKREQSDPEGGRRETGNTTWNISHIRERPESKAP
jgi:hypothetical protein